MASFSYSTNGEMFSSFDKSFEMNTDWEFFTGRRYGIFNYATGSLGGAATVKSFDLAQNISTPSTLL
ncbi:hypothetical protein CPB85DRAFT_300068 [Mucidula mucida]|nr:hypothetical protein CPB85DRAFT_300068 [Mucidula mucida]